MKNIYIIDDISSFLQDDVCFCESQLKSKNKVKSLNQRDHPKEQNINFLFLCRSLIFTVKSHLVTKRSLLCYQIKHLNIYSIL